MVATSATTARSSTASRYVPATALGVHNQGVPAASAAATHEEALVPWTTGATTSLAVLKAPTRSPPEGTISAPAAAAIWARPGVGQSLTTVTLRLMSRRRQAGTSSSSARMTGASGSPAASKLSVATRATPSRSANPLPGPGANRGGPRRVTASPGRNPASRLASASLAHQAISMPSNWRSNRA